MKTRYNQLLEDAPDVILCAKVIHTYTDEEFYLKLDYTELDLQNFEIFLNKRQIEKDKKENNDIDELGYFIDSTVWFKDGSWAKWVDSDSMSPGWWFLSCPIIPNQCIFSQK